MDRSWYVGLDIGGTTSAAVLIDGTGEVAGREELSTTKGASGWRPTVDRLRSAARAFVDREDVRAIGVSCGGPLDSARGLIRSPPNLPGWDDVPIVEILREEFELPTALENDANAGALAEWRFGAGRGRRNLVFLTFGTGLGAGLVLDGRLYRGTSDLAGEAGHVRLAHDGPLGYHKRGSFEGFCSGTGLAQLMGFELLRLMEERGRAAVVDAYREPGEVTGRDVVEWALAGDELALGVVRTSGEYLGRGLSILLDVLNPEVVVVGSMGVRLGDLLFEPAREVIEREALPGAAEVCEIVPAALGEEIGDYAALSVAVEAAEGGDRG